jgi:hypothetical protein
VNHVVGHRLSVSGDDDPGGPRRENQILQSHVAEVVPKEVTHEHVRPRAWLQAWRVVIH